MKQPTRAERPDLRIRAVCGWFPKQGPKTPDLALSASDKAELGRLAEVIVYRSAGVQIVMQGQDASFVHLLADGVVQADCTVNDGERQVLAFYWPGDLFVLAQGGVYAHSARALTPCTVYRFPVRQLEAFLLEHPRILHSFLIKAIHELRSAQRRIISLGRFGISRRLAIFLIDSSGYDRYFDRDSQVLTLPMTRYDIADYLGTSAESTTRAFGELEHRGLIQRLAARTVRLRLVELKAFADFD